MNDPISNSILLIMVLIIVLCVTLIAVLAVLGVRYLGEIRDQGLVAEDQRNALLTVQRQFDRRDALHRPTQDGPPHENEVRQPIEAAKPEGLSINTCDRGVHDPHTWRPKKVTHGKWETVEPELAWCPGLTAAQEAEAVRLATLAEQTPHSTYVRPFGLRASSDTAARASKGETLVDVPPKPAS